MIIGNGLIATAMQCIDSDDILFFASGVSNSSEENPEAYQREFSLLKKTVAEHPFAKLMYFSTLSILDQSKTGSLYIAHKLKIEEFIQKNCPNFLIVRIGNIVGAGGNPNTLFNFLKHKIAAEQQIALHQRARRFLVDIEDLTAFLHQYSKKINQEILYFAYPYPYTLQEIISSLEVCLNKKATCEMVDDGDFYPVQFDDEVCTYFSAQKPAEYLKLLSEKYAR